MTLVEQPGLALWLLHRVEGNENGSRVREATQHTQCNLTGAHTHQQRIQDLVPMNLASHTGVTGLHDFAHGHCHVEAA